MQMPSTETLNPFQPESESHGQVCYVCCEKKSRWFEQVFLAATCTLEQFGESELMLHRVGFAQMRLGNFKKATQWLEKSEKLAAENNKKITANQICRALIKIAKAMGMTQEAF